MADDKNEWAEALERRPDLKRRIIAGLDKRPSRGMMEQLRDAALEAEREAAEIRKDAKLR